MGRDRQARFEGRVTEAVGEEYTFIGAYTKAKDKIVVIHNICGHEYEVTPDNFLNKGTRCPKCNGGVKKTDEEFKQEIKDLVGEEYTVHDKYINTHTAIEFTHNTCGNVFKKSPGAFTSQGQRCPRCSRGSQKELARLTNSEFTQDILDLVGDEYTFLEEYKGNRERILVRHNICGHEYQVVPSRFKQGNRCKNCVATSQRKTQEEFIEEVSMISDGKYSVMGEYRAARFLIEFKHEECGHHFLSTPNNFISGNRCPNCYISKGEERIASFLKENDIAFEREYTFDDLTHINKLRFDFMVTRPCNDAPVLIEYDGKQHFEPIEVWGGEDYLKDIIARDKKKDEFALNKEIDLIRIPYWDFDNIESILSEKIQRETIKI